MAKFFKRKLLAAKLAYQLLNTESTSSAGSGLFLAAPRRTGKSTFVREDLRPELETMGALVVYVDLWANKKTDPGEAITAAIRTELAKHDGAIKQLSKALGLEKLGVPGGTTFNLTSIGTPQGSSLSATLAALSDEEKKVIVLIIDEAQHAITTAGGSDTLFALKAARDELNSSQHYGLRIVCTGSNQDKLAMLRNNKDQAFFGAPLINFPPLGKDYIEWFCQHTQLGAPLDPAWVHGLFVQAAFRPEILGAAADSVRFQLDMEVSPDEIPQQFAQAVEREIEASRQETARVIKGLTPLQESVLRVLARDGANFEPFAHATMASYQNILDKLDPSTALRVEQGNAQQALLALQEKTLVWRAARGVYALEDTGLAEFLEQSSGNQLTS